MYLRDCIFIANILATLYTCILTLHYIKVVYIYLRIYVYIGRWDADAGVATFDGTVPVGRSLEMAGFGPGSSPSPICALFARSPFLPSSSS